MDEVEELYNEGKLLVRAVELPFPRVKKEPKYFDCEVWENEIEYLIKNGLNSLSTTLVIPGVGVRTYKNVGYLVNANLADCFHIAKEDSGSSGSIKRGDFWANKPDFDTIEELAVYIKQNNATTMNEVNVNIELDAIVGLFINKCEISNKLLRRIYVIKKLLEHMTGKEYPIYLYDYLNGKLEGINLSREQEEELIASLECDKIYYWPDDCEEPSFIPIEPTGYHK